MEFGVFDHLDRTGQSLPDFYEDRLKIAEAYDRAGFYAYHIAEHHSTPLGMAPSPNVFLAAVAQRTRRLRFGPLVFVLPLYHPVRLIAEICMLDQMSGGRLELSFGRGASPIEIEYFSIDPEARQDIYAEAVDVILKGLTHKTLDFHGKHFAFDNVPMELEPLQKPHPPLWYGVHAPDSAERAAKRDLHVVSLDSRDLAAGTSRRRHAQARSRPLHRGGGNRRAGVASRAARLSAVAPQFHPSAAAARTRADPSAAAAMGCAGRSRTGHRRITQDSDGVFAVAACRDRLQLRRRAIRLRRSDARRMPELDRLVRQRSHAGAAGSADS
jgi:hypothetical protein